jgi:dTDP-4-dehydrorhamnose 3,5-epimerase
MLELVEESVTVVGIAGAAKDAQSVTCEGEPVGPSIDGVLVRHAVTHADERGKLTEIFDARWGFSDEPVTYAYFFTLRPERAHGWVVQPEWDDRLFFARGTAKLALYDTREGSPTAGLVEVRYFGDHDRALVRIPAGVARAVKNVGDDEVVFVNLPTEPYPQANPGSSRAVADAEIPYRL